jgi:hypothetical protein
MVKRPYATLKIREHVPLKLLYVCTVLKVKVKQSHTGLGRPLGLQEVEATTLNPTSL